MSGIMAAMGTVWVRAKQRFSFAKRAVAVLALGLSVIWLGSQFIHMRYFFDRGSMQVTVVQLHGGQVDWFDTYIEASMIPRPPFRAYGAAYRASVSKMFTLRPWLDDQGLFARMAYGGFPIFPYMFLLAILCGLFYFLERLARYGPGHCQICGYNLSGNVSGICPECGTKSSTGLLQFAHTAAPPPVPCDLETRLPGASSKAVAGGDNPPHQSNIVNPNDVYT
jgi:hypothetical protein